MACGCAEECCGICVHAQAAGRTRENAADWEPPDLNALRGRENREERNGEAGKPVLWFWQMTGTRWDLAGKSFDAAKKAWRRLAATQEERSEETLARLERADERRVKQRTAEAQAQTQTVSLEEALFRAGEATRQEEKRAEQAAAREEQSREWRAVSKILRRCGLNRLAADASAMHQSGACASRLEPRASRLTPHPPPPTHHRRSLLAVRAACQLPDAAPLWLRARHCGHGAAQ